MSPDRRHATLAARALALACALAPVLVPAATRVDDSGSVVSAPVVQMRWRQLVPGRAADHTVEARLRVALRLNVDAWRNRHVRIYMVLPPQLPESLQASWRTQGRLLPGQLRPGSRALVFDGPVTGPVLEETIELTLAADGRVLSGTHTLPFSFELENP